MLMRQVDLQCEDHHQSCWVPAWIQNGDRVRFEGDSIFWDVKKVYDVIDSDREDFWCACIHD